MSNLNLPIPDSLIDVSFRPDGMIDGSDTEDLLCGAGAERFPDEFLIPRSEWDDYIREHEKYKSSADYFSSHFTNQSPTHECVSHAAMQVFSVAWNKQFAGLTRDVWLSPLALYTRCTNGRERGGTSVNLSLQIMINEGMLPEFDGPDGPNCQYNKFLHTVQQTGGSHYKPHWPARGFIRPSQLPSGWQETAKHFRVLEAFTIPSREAHISALLRGWAVSNGRQGHSIPHMNMVKRNGSYYSRYRDSYEVWRFDSENMLGGGFCIRSVTKPSDDSRPAGD